MSSTPVEPVFSVVIPVYNRANTILATLESVKFQTFSDFECLVIDDGSNDGQKLREVIRSLNDDRFIYLRQDNAGGGAARATGIKNATGSYLALLDSDDLFELEKLEHVYRAILQKPNVDVWSHFAKMIRGGGVSIIRPTRIPDASTSIADLMFRQREFLQTSTIVVRMSYAKIVSFDPRLQKAQDVDFMIRLERIGATRGFIPEVLSIWNDVDTGVRVGAPRRPSSVQMWYQEQKSHFPRITRYAFEGSYLAYEISRESPFRAAFLIARSTLSSAIGPKLGLACLLRCFMPSGVYRTFMDFVVKRNLLSGRQQ